MRACEAMVKLESALSPDKKSWHAAKVAVIAAAAPAS